MIRRQRPQSSAAPIREVDSLVPLLIEQDRIAEKSRGGEPFIHLSAVLGEFCARRHAIQFRYPDSFTGVASPNPADRLLWAIGRAVEHHIRTQLIASLTPAAFLGRWVCACPLSTEYVGVGLITPRTCPTCRGPINRYRELALFPEGVPVIGSPDLLRLHGKEVEVIEIKSIKKEDFEALQAPTANHVMQASGYNHLLKGLLPHGFTVRETARVLYGCKDYPRFGAAAYKEYLFTARETAGQLINAAAESLRPVFASPQAALPPRLPACSSAATTRAKNCGACNLCFHL